MNRRNVTIAVIAVLALGVGLVVYGILATPRKGAAPPRNVVVAAMNIPANTRIVPAMVSTVQKPGDEVEPAALSDTADAVGMMAAADIPQGAVMTPNRLARPAVQAHGLQVAVGLRAITLAVDNVKGVAGLLVPGDHVDVLAAPIQGGGGAWQAFAIVRDARILAVGRDVGVPQPAATGSPAPESTVPPNTWITLAVTPPEADTIMAADLGGIVRLALRSAHEPARSMTAETIVYSQPTAKTAAPAGPPKPQGVVVVNGSDVTRVVP